MSNAKSHVLIDHAALLGGLSDAGLCSHLDAPRTGSSDERYQFDVYGWVYSTMAGRTVTGVRIVQDGSPVRTVPLSVPRPDVAQVDPAAPAVCGFWTSVGTLGLPRTFCLEVRAIIGDSELEIPFAFIEGCRNVPLMQTAGCLRPLLVTSLGRSGSTWLMRLLSSHPSVVTYPAYPYEVRPARYWLHAMRVAVEPANHAESASPGSFSSSPWSCGHNPFHTAPLTDDPRLAEWFGRSFVEQTASQSAVSIEAFYRKLAESSLRPDAIYFAEKYFPDTLCDLACDAYPAAKEIILIRDVRDVICSIFSFNHRRGFADFGRAEVRSDREYIRHLRESAERLLRRWERQSGSAKLVRYEDLVLKPRETLQGIYSFLGLPHADVDAAVSESEETSADLTTHKTSTSTARSSGRWRDDLPPELRTTCERELTGVLASLGYEV